MFAQRHPERLVESGSMPNGHRSTWAKRGKLCVAKLAAQITPNTTPEDFQSILMKQGKKPAEDVFVEVHVFGPMTIRTFEKVVITRQGRHPSKAKIDALRMLLANCGTQLEVRP